MQDNYISDIKKAWEAYVKEGIIMDIVKPIIAESWERSKKYGVDPYSRKSKIASGDELRSILKKK